VIVLVVILVKRGLCINFPGQPRAVRRGGVGVVSRAVRTGGAGSVVYIYIYIYTISLSLSLYIYVYVCDHTSHWQFASHAKL
jgi:hypothetical protein